VESDYWNVMLLSNQEDSMGRRGYAGEFRQRVLDLVAAGLRVGDIARDVGISDQAIYES
jgi:transposase-like protein